MPMGESLSGFYLSRKMCENLFTVGFSRVGAKGRIFVRAVEREYMDAKVRISVRISARWVT